MEEGGLVRVSVSAAGSGASLIRDLAACNKSIRDRALKRVLKTWLPSQQPGKVSDDDMKKLWKGLFYCVWHADKAPVQSDLINRLSSLLLALSLPISLHYLSVFLLTMRREWAGIDALRLDKFYLLIRRFLHCSFHMLKKNYSWDLEITRGLMRVLEEKSFFTDDNFPGNGVNYHIASIFLEELKSFLPLSPETLDVIFKPFLLVTTKCKDKVFLGKVKSNVFEVLLNLGRNLLDLKKLKLGDDPVDDDDGDNSVVVLGTIALTMGFSTKFYELGSSPECLQGNRKVLFSLHEDFLRLEKDLELAGIEIQIPDSMVDDEDEVLKLVPVAAETEGAGSEAAIEGANVPAHKPLKKRKKVSDRGNDKTKALDGAAKKAMKKKKKKKKNVLPEQFPAEVDEGDAIIANVESSSNGTTICETKLDFDDCVISNLQRQFEKVAAEIALDKDGSHKNDSPENTVRATVSRKRKRTRSMDGKDALSHNPDLVGGEDTGGDAVSTAGKSLDKSTKRVRFSMKNNLVWKPHSPLPPQSLRLPPSATPRGSALKKGLSPGPIREMPHPTQKVKQKKKGRKGVKKISPAIKRLRKLQASI